MIQGFIIQGISRVSIVVVVVLVELPLELRVLWWVVVPVTSLVVLRAQRKSKPQGHKENKETKEGLAAARAA